MNDGLLANTAILGGVSGSGKTWTSIATLAAYTLRVMTDPATEWMRQQDMARIFQDPSLVPVGTCPEGQPVQYQNGRVTHACIQNETVDHSYETFTRILNQMSDETNTPRRLIIRCHAVQSELKAIIAMLDPFFGLGEAGDPTLINRNSKLQGTTNERLLAHYLNHFQLEHPGITDRRFRKIDGSVASVILQLAAFDGFTMSDEVRNTWNEQERKALVDELRPLTHIARDIDAKGSIDKEGQQKAKACFWKAYQRIVERASVICCTASVANDSTFQLYRKATAVCLEEAGRATDIEVMGFMSNYWDVKLRMFVGCWNQLGPQAFGNQLDNPFQAQLSTSPLARLHLTGFPIQSLNQTSRFSNSALLEIC